MSRPIVSCSAPHLNDLATTVYRCFAADGRLLYIGMTADLDTRLKAHRNRSHWFGDVDRVTTEVHPDRPTAALAEFHAIEAERPENNRPARREKPLPRIEPHAIASRP